MMQIELDEKIRLSDVCGFYIIVLCVASIDGYLYAMSRGGRPSLITCNNVCLLETMTFQTIPKLCSVDILARDCQYSVVLLICVLLKMIWCNNKTEKKKYN